MSMTMIVYLIAYPNIFYSISIYRYYGISNNIYRYYATNDIVSQYTVNVIGLFSDTMGLFFERVVELTLPIGSGYR